MDDDERHVAGLEVRRRVLGDQWVDESLAAADAFTRDLQEHLNRFCWGVVWTRPGLDLRTRSLVTLAILTALGKSEEVKLHTRGALRNGATADEIKEVFLHAAVYAGVPCAVAAFGAARPIVAEVTSA